MSYEYDSDLRLTHIFSSSGKLLFEGAYDAYNRLIRITIGENTVKQKYSLEDRSSTVSGLSGLELERRYGQNYDLIGHKIKQDYFIDPSIENESIEVVLDESGEKQWEYEYDKEDVVCKATDYFGNIWKFFYDYKKNLVLKEDPKGDVTGFVYDEFNRIKHKFEHLSAVKNIRYHKLLQRGAHLAAFICETTQGIFHLVCEDKHKLDIEYNSIGRIEKMSVLDEMTQFCYDENGLLIGVTLPSGYMVKREFDEQFRVKSVSDKKGLLYSFIYNEQGQLVEDISWLGSMQYQYSDGKIMKITDRLRNSTEFVYNRDHLVQTIDAEGNSIRAKF